MHLSNQYAPPVGIDERCTHTLDVPFAPPAGTDALVDNLLQTRFEDLSEDNVRIFKDRLLDMTGCLFGGTIVPEDAFLETMLKRWGGAEEAPLFARSGRLPLPAAAMLNAITARANDFGSMFFRVFGERMPSHCGETLIPLNLTLADVIPVSGRDFIARNVAAEDMTGRILYTLPVRWPTDMLLVSGAAAALAAPYYGLDAAQTKSALTYAACNATDPANSYYDYSQEFKYHNGESARMGVMACELARGGWTGWRDPFFGHWGLVTRQIKDGGLLPANYEKAFSRLGEVYFTEESFKQGPGGIPTSSAARCGAKVREKIIAACGSFDASQIKRVRVLKSNLVPVNYYSNPFTRRNQINALFCFQFVACCALLHGETRADLVQTPAIRADKRLTELAEESTMEVFESGTKQMRVIVEMHDGRGFEHTEDFEGSKHAYPSREFLEKKFWDQYNAWGKGSRAAGEKIIELAGKIETLDDMREYTSLLTLTE